MSYITLLILAFTVFVLIVTRVHYSIDIIFGFIIAHYIWILWDKYSYIFDYYIFAIPLEKRLATDDQNKLSDTFQEEI